MVVPVLVAFHRPYFRIIIELVLCFLLYEHSISTEIL